MSTFVLIHGGGDVGWSWHLVEAELRARGHEVVAPDLPGVDDALTLDDYADAVIAAVGDRRDLVVVGHSLGGFTAALVAVRLPVDALVFVAGMIPAAGEAPWPLDALPDVPTRIIPSTEERPLHAALGRPVELADLLEAAGRRTTPRLRLIDHYDAELHHINRRFRAATAVAAGERVLDIGCGGGESSRDAARAGAASVLGVDITPVLLDRARRLTSDAGITNITYELGDAQTHALSPGAFDVIISRLGTMFFADPLAAFTNIARAAKPGGRLCLLVWQAAAQNEWATAIEQALGKNPFTGSADAFSLADPATTEALLTSAGLADVAFQDVREPVFYGKTATAALELLRDIRAIRDVIARMQSANAQRVVRKLRDVIEAHQTSEGVLFDSRTWIVTARRRV